MWMCDPKILCRKHLLGEHVELHMFASTLKAGKRVDGYLRNNCLQPNAIVSRHGHITEEMTRRGYKHNSPLRVVRKSHLTPEQRRHKVNKWQSVQELLKRCPECRARNKEV
jgi:hypothetical protein